MEDARKWEEWKVSNDKHDWHEFLQDLSYGMTQDCSTKIALFFGKSYGATDELTREALNHLRTSLYRKFEEMLYDAGMEFTRRAVVDTKVFDYDG